MTYSAVINKQRHYLSIMNVAWKQLEAAISLLRYLRQKKKKMNAAFDER